MFKVGDNVICITEDAPYAITTTNAVVKVTEIDPSDYIFTGKLIGTTDEYNYRYIGDIYGDLEVNLFALVDPETELEIITRSK